MKTKSLYEQAQMDAAIGKHMKQNLLQYTVFCVVTSAVFLWAKLGIKLYVYF